jgi:hypothetical protein
VFDVPLDSRRKHSLENFNCLVRSPTLHATLNRGAVRDSIDFDVAMIFNQVLKDVHRSLVLLRPGTRAQKCGVSENVRLDSSIIHLAEDLKRPVALFCLAQRVDQRRKRYRVRLGAV